MKNFIFLFLLLSFVWLGCNSSPWDKTYSQRNLENDMKALQEDEEKSLSDVVSLAAYIMEHQWLDKEQLKGKTYRNLLKEAQEHHSGLGGLMKPAFNIAKEFAKGMEDVVKNNSKEIEEIMKSMENIGKSLQKELEKDNTIEDKNDMNVFFNNISEITKHGLNPQADWNVKIQEMFGNASELLKEMKWDTSFSFSSSTTITSSFSDSTTKVLLEKAQKELKEMEKKMDK